MKTLSDMFKDIYTKELSQVDELAVCRLFGIHLREITEEERLWEEFRKNEYNREDGYETY